MSPTASAPPPEYTEQDIAIDLTNLNLSSTDFPTVDQCIAHLKLLEAFHALRQAVGKTEGLFGIHNELASTTTGGYKDGLLKIFEKRWAIYVARAAGRFESWYETCMPSSFNGLVRPRFAQSDLSGRREVEFPYYPGGGASLTFTADNLPPLGMFYSAFTFLSSERVLN